VGEIEGVFLCLTLSEDAWRQGEGDSEGLAETAAMLGKPPPTPVQYRPMPSHSQRWAVITRLQTEVGSVNDE